MKTDKELLAMIEHPPEFLDVFKVFEASVLQRKYEPNSWLNEDPHSCGMGHVKNHDSIGHHLAHAFVNPIGVDDGPGGLRLHNQLMVGCRSLMEYTRLKRGLKI